MPAAIPPPTTPPSRQKSSTKTKTKTKTRAKKGQGHDPLAALEARLIVLEAQAHTEHTLSGISNELLDQVAALAVARLALLLQQQLQVPRVTQPGEADVVESR